MRLRVEPGPSVVLGGHQIEVVALDIKAALWQEEVDAAAVNKLVDKKYELKKAKAQALVSAYAELKSMLTKAQKDKMKELWKKGEKGGLPCPMKEKMGHPMMMQGKMLPPMADK